jgi:hypothetical protein
MTMSALLDRKSWVVGGRHAPMTLGLEARCREQVGPTGRPDEHGCLLLSSATRSPIWTSCGLAVDQSRSSRLTSAARMSGKVVKQARC